MLKSECIKVLNDQYFEVYECEEDNVSKIKDNNINCNTETFEVFNDNSLNITFLAIDKCQFSDSDKFERCDFAIYTDKEVNFVELKVNAKPKNRKKQRNKAIEQLKSTIVQLQDLIIDKKLYCFICFGKNIKIPNSSIQTKFVEFQENYNAILKISCEKYYEV